MSELLTPPEQQNTDEWFKQESLSLLAQRLQRLTYPGYPVLADRLCLPEVAETDPVVLPPGPWEVTTSPLPTPVEQLTLQQRIRRWDSVGRPLHPWFQAMVTNPDIGIVTGKGFFYHWGPNDTADPIVLRHDLEQPHVLLIERQDGTGWALPGGFIEMSEAAADAAIREAWEETGVDLSRLAADIRQIYQGPVADLRATAHAWPETTAVRIDLAPEATEALQTMRWPGGDDAKTAGWFPIDSLDNYLFGSHKLLIIEALREGAPWNA